MGSLKRGIAATSLVALSTLALSGCGGSDAKSEAKASVSASATPTVQATPTPSQTKPTVSDEEILKMRDANGCPPPDTMDLMKSKFPAASDSMYQGLKQQSYDVFSQQPASSQVDYFMNVAFDQMYHMRYSHFLGTKSVDGVKLFAYNPFCLPLQKEANPLRIVMQNTFAQGLARAIPADPSSPAAAVSSTPLNKVEASKLEGGSSYPSTRIYQSGLDSINASDVTAQIDAAVVSTTRVLSDKDVQAKLPDGTEVAAKEIIYNTSSDTFKDTLMFVPSETLSTVTGVPGSGLWVTLNSTTGQVTVQ